MDEDRIFINDGPIWTSAGMTAGIDLGLALIENDLGPELAKAVARKLVIYHRRGGGQSQFSTLLELSPNIRRHTRSADADDLLKLLTVREFAEWLISARDIQPGVPRRDGSVASESDRKSPGRGCAGTYGTEPTSHRYRRASDGFSDRDHMRRAFLRAFGQPPQVQRRNDDQNLL